MPVFTDPSYACIYWPLVYLYLLTSWMPVSTDPHMPISTDISYACIYWPLVHLYLLTSWMPVSTDPHMPISTDISYACIYWPLVSKMPTVRNARSLVTSRELPSGLQIWGKRPAECIVLSGSNERWHRQRVCRERQSNSRTRRPWYAIRTFDVSNNEQPP